MVRFRIGDSQPVTVRILDAAGRVVRDLHRGWLPPGPHEVAWDGCDATGAAVAAGVYFCTLESAALTESRKLSVVR